MDIPIILFMVFVDNLGVMEFYTWTEKMCCRFWWYSTTL